MAKNKVTGIGEVITALENMGANIENDRLQQGIRQSSQVIIDAAKARVPVDSGDLRDSIGFIESKDSTYKSKVLIGLRKTYYNHYLGVMFEYGTEPRLTKKGADRGVIMPRPFIRPAVDQNREKVLTGVKSTVIQTITDLAQKNGLEFKP